MSLIENSLRNPRESLSAATATSTSSHRATDWRATGRARDLVARAVGRGRYGCGCRTQGPPFCSFNHSHSEPPLINVCADQCKSASGRNPAGSRLALSGAYIYRR